MVSIQPFGAFVNLLPGKDGLLHISRVAKGRVEKVEDVLNVGDEVKVVVIEVDDRGKISLDRLDKPEAPARAEVPPRATASTSSVVSVRVASAPSAATVRAVPATTEAASPAVTTTPSNSRT